MKMFQTILGSATVPNLEVKSFDFHFL